MPSAVVSRLVYRLGHAGMVCGVLYALLLLGATLAQAVAWSWFGFACKEVVDVVRQYQVVGWRAALRNASADLVDGTLPVALWWAMGPFATPTSAFLATVFWSTAFLWTEPWSGA